MAIRLNRNAILGASYQSLSNEVIGKTIPITSSLSTNVYNISPDFTVSFISDFVPIQHTKVINNLYREIYMFDTIGGPTVDLYSNLPWSDYVISGVDKKVKHIFEETLAELDIISLMSSLSIIYLVLGHVIGTLIFNESKGIFTDVIIQNPDYCEITPIPLYGYAPKIDLVISPELSKFLRSTDKRDLEAKKEIPQKMFARLLKSNKIELEPVNTIYVARTTIPGVQYVSFYSRILPIWLIEKALMRGTIIGAWRRQRSILHIIAGTDEWEPTDQQLDNLVELFIQADQDPQGAVIATRQGVEVNEVRAGADFWKVTEEWDTFANAKLRALGVSEAFLSGDANFNTMEAALSSFMENLKAFRNKLTKNVILDKIFLILSKYHGIRKRTQAEITHRIRLNSPLSVRESYRQSILLGKKDLSDVREYLIPNIHWTKELSAKYDSQYLDILSSLEGKGIPIPLKLYASVCGINLDDIFKSLKEDVDLRKKLKEEYFDKVKGLKPQEEGGMFAKEMVLSAGDSAKILKEEKEKIINDKPSLA